MGMSRFTCSVPAHLMREEYRLTNNITGEIVQGELKPLLQYLTRSGRDTLNSHDIWTLERLYK